MIKKNQKKKYLKLIKSKLLPLNPFTVFILIIISVIAFSLVKHQRVSLHKQTIRVEVVGKDWSSNYSQYNGYRPPYWLVENLKLGSKEVAPDGRTIAEIVDIEYFERFGGNTQMFLIVELEVVDNVSSGATVYKGGNIEIGETIELHLDNTFIIGQITDIDYSKDDIEIEELLITGIYKRVKPYAANSFHEGMTISNPFTGKIYAIVESVKVTPNVDLVLSDYQYDSVLRLEKDYTLKNVELTLKLVTEKHLGQNFYSGHQLVKTGEFITLMFPEIKTGSMEVTDVSVYKETK